MSLLVHNLCSFSAFFLCVHKKDKRLQWGKRPAKHAIIKDPNKMKLQRITYTLLAIMVFLSWTSLVQATLQEYSITDLGTLGGFTSNAFDINDNGQVAGQSIAPFDFHAFLYDTVNGMVDLGTLTDGMFSHAWSVNANGQVAGFSEIKFGRRDTRIHAFIYDSVNGMTSIGTLGGEESQAYSINSSGQVAGYSQITGNSATHAFIYDSVNGMVDIGTLGGSTSLGYALNDNGQVVGRSSTTGDATSHAFIYDSVNGMTDLGHLGGSLSYSEARDINNNGQVVGNSQAPGNLFRAFLYDNTNGMIDLGTLGGSVSFANGISESGHVFGVSEITGSITQHAFIYDDINGMRDLNDFLPAGSGWTLTSASDMNASGQIVGTGIIGGQHHAFLMTPIPEPMTMSLLALGGVAIMRRKRNSLR